MSRTLHCLLACGAIALGGCELFLDLDDGEDPFPPAPIDAGDFFPDAATVDAGPVTPFCTRDSSYVDRGVPGRLYRTLGSFSWPGGESRCAQDGAQIVSINNAGEESAMANLLAGLPTAVNCPRQTCMWVGLSQGAAAAPEDGWGWADGTAEDPTLWVAGQPDDGDGLEAGAEDCAMMEAGGLHDESCAAQVFTVCECDLSTAAR